ncbi:MAG TPA: PQQ-binding-like beta-propeller repeat protein [Actinokineospora sp.]|nr:PQQ-binding-like beta-propeller repeat protein [Actinokineospora sp.]
MNRRHFVRLGGLGLAAAAAAIPLTDAAAAARPGRRDPTVTDLGPGIVQFSLMSGLLSDDTVYIGSRNLDPTSVIGFHLPTRRVVSRTDLGPGSAVQAIAVDADGRHLYAGILYHDDRDQPNLFHWDLSTPGTPAVAVARIQDLDVRDLAVARDGKVYAVGSRQSPPALWEYDPATGTATKIVVPDPLATISQAVVVTDTTVFYASGSIITGGAGASQAKLFAIDRATQAVTSVLPPELATGSSVTELCLIGNQLIVGAKGPGRSAIMNVADLSSYTLIPSTGKLFRALRPDICFYNNSRLLVYSPATGKVTPLPYTGPDLGEVWGLDVYGDRVVAVSAYGFVAEVDPTTGATVVTDLAEAGAPAAPQLGMSVAAGAGAVYVGGTGGLARHELNTGSVVIHQAPGEAKDALVLGGVLYTGQYNSQGIWAHDPTAGAPHQVATFPAEQNRPLDVCWDDTRLRLLVGAQSDTRGGGSLWTFDPTTRQTTCHVNPVDTQQCVRAVAAHNGVAYLGGDNPYTTGPRGTLVAFDPTAGTELWRLDPGQAYGIVALATHGHHLYGISRRGGLFIVDLDTRRIVHTADIRSICPQYAALATSRGVVYGVSDTTLFRFDPATFAVTVVVAGLNGEWYSGPHLTVDENGQFYTLRGRNLIRVQDFPDREQSR